jgi:hypothetical protein
LTAAEIGAEQAAEHGIEVFTDEIEWDVIEEIPNDSAAALILIEHHCAVPLRDSIARAGGFRIADGMIGPLDLFRSAWPAPRRSRSCRPTRSARRLRPRDPFPHPGGMTMLGVNRRVARRTSRRVARRR